VPDQRPETRQLKSAGEPEYGGFVELETGAWISSEGITTFSGEASLKAGHKRRCAAEAANRNNSLPQDYRFLFA